MSFKIGSLNYSVEMIPGWLVISLECTEICASRKSLIAKISRAEFNNMTLNSKISNVVSYIQDNKSWERIYVILKINFPCLRTLSISDSIKAGMDKVFYYSIMKKIYIIKSSSDLDKNNYSQYLTHHLKRYVFHQIDTLKRTRVLIPITQRVMIQIFRKALVR